MLKQLAIAALSLAIVACGSPSEPSGATDAPGTTVTMTQLADRLIEDGTRVSELLAQVTDAESAEAIKPRLEEIMTRYSELATEFEQMGEPGFAEMAALASRGPQIARTQGAVVEEIRRIYRDHPEASDVLAKSLDAFQTP